MRRLSVVMILAVVTVAVGVGAALYMGRAKAPATKIDNADLSQFSDAYLKWLPAGANPHDLELRERYTRETGRNAVIPADWKQTFTAEYLEWLPPGASPHDLALRERYTREKGRPALR